MLLAKLSLDTAILCAAVVWLLFALTFAALGRAEPGRRAVWFWAAAYALGAVRHVLSLADVQGHYTSEAAALFALGATSLHAAGAGAAAGWRISKLALIGVPVFAAALYLAGRMAGAPSALTALPIAMLIGGYLLAAGWAFAVRARSEAFHACLAVATTYGLWGVLAATFPAWSRLVPEFLPAATIVNMLLGALVGILLIVIALLETERRTRAFADEAQRAKRRFEQVVDATSDWVWEIDEQHRYTFFSPRVEEVTKADIPTLIGERRDLFWANFPDSPLWEDYRAHLQARRPFRDFRYPAISGDGRRITLSISGSPIFDSSGRFEGYRGSGRDVTEETIVGAIHETFAGPAANQVGIAFFQSLVARLGTVLGTGVAFIARIDGGDGIARSIAAYQEGANIDNFTYELSRSAGRDALDGKPFVCLENARSRFPDDTVLRDFELDSYAAIALIGADSRAIGILALGSRTRCGDEHTIRRALSAAAPRAAAELDREISMQAFREGDARFRAVIDNLPLSLAARDLDGRFVFSNRTYEGIVGIPAEELLGRTLRELSSRFGDDVMIRRIEATDRAVVDSGDIVTEEATRADARHQGAMTTQFVTEFPIRDATGTLVAVGSAAIDITERKRMEDRLRISEERFRAVVDNLPIAFQLKDLSGRYLIANAAFANMIGLPTDRIVGHTLEDLETGVVEPEFFRNARMADEKLLSSGQAVSGEYVQPDPRGTGEMVVVAMTKFPIRGSAGQIIAVGTALQDVTADWQLSRERSAREAEARASEARFRAVIDNLPFGFHLRDLEGRYVIVNRAFEIARGVPTAEILGKTPRELASHARYPEGADGSEERHEAVVKTGQTAMFELQLPDPHDPEAKVHISVTKFPVAAADGRVSGVGSLLIDVTQRQRMDEAMRESEARLRSILDNMPYEFAARDRQGHFIIANRRYAEIIGASEGEILGETPATLAGRLDLQDFYAGWQENDRRVLDEGQAWTFEADYFEPRDRSRISPRLMSKFPIRDSKQEIVAVGTLAIDISDRRRMELERDQRDAAIRENEARLRSVLNGMPYDFSARDREGRFVFVGDRYAERLGLPAEQILGSNPDQIAERLGIPNLFSNWRENDARVLSEGRPWSFEADYPMTGSGGKVSPYLISKFPIRDAEGSIVAAATLGIDITERRRLELERDARETALRQSEARFRAVIDHMPISFRLKDVQGRLLIANRIVEQVTGLSADEMLGLTTDEIAARSGLGESRSFHVEDQQTVIETKKPLTREITFETPNHPGVPQYWERTVFPVLDEHGSVSSVGFISIDVTERRRFERERQAREAALRESEARFRAVVDNLPIGFQLKGRDQRYIMVNQALAAMVGRTAEAMQGRTAEELSLAIGDPRLFAGAAADDREVLEARRTVSREVEEPDPKDPSRHIFLARIKFPLLDDSGNLVAIGTLVTDITERRRLESERAAREASIRESEARFRAVIDNMPIGLSIKTLDGRFVAVNRAHQSMMNIPATQSLGSTAPQIATERGLPGLYDRFVVADRVVLEQRRPETFEVTLPHASGPNGNNFYLISKFPIPDEAGETVSIGTMITDITGQKQLTEAIAAREADLRRVLAALDMMREGITVEDRTGQVLYANHAARELIDRRRGALALLDAEMHNTKLIEQGHWSGEVTVRHSSRGALEVRVDSVALADGTVVSIVEDVTDDRARRRETEVLARRLQHSEKMEALGRFAGGIAHDFNNLLGAIVGFAGFIAEDSGPEDSNRVYAERILAAGNRAKNVIQEILGFSRTDEPVKELVVIGDLVRETVDIIHSTLAATTNIEVSTPDEPVAVAANGDQITRVLMNLLINASDALEGAAGNVRITVGTTEIGAGIDMEPARTSPGLDVVELPQGGWRSVAGRVLPGTYVTIDVADPGQGMSRDVLEKIYDPFFTTKGRGKGTGLGLPLVHGIVLAHAGAIIVETVPGQGSLFRILLPTAVAPVIRSRREAADATAPGSGRVLIVDDDQDFGDMVQTALDRAGYETAVINDPVEALKVLSEDPAIWDLVVTDLNMPGLSGTELIGAIRKLRADLPCVLCTGFGLDIDEQQALALGASAFRRKPVDVAALIGDIGGLIRSAKPG